MVYNINNTNNNLSSKQLNTKYLKKTTKLTQATDKLDHIMLTCIEYTLLELDLNSQL